MKAPEYGVAVLLCHQTLEGNRTNQEEEGTELIIVRWHQYHSPWSKQILKSHLLILLKWKRNASVSF